METGTSQITEGILKSWIVEVNSWGYGISASEISSTMQRLDSVRELLDSLNRTLRTYKTPSEVVSELPSTGKLISRLLQNHCLQSSPPTYSILLECLQAFSSASDDSSVAPFDTRASRWADELVRGAAILRFPHDKLTSAVCRCASLPRRSVASAKAEASSRAIRKRMRALPTREWSNDSMEIVPVTSFSGKVHRHMALTLLPVAGENDVQATVQDVVLSSAVCDVFQTKEVEGLKKDSLFVETCPTEVSVPSELLTSLSTNNSSFEIKALRWISHKSIYEEDFLSAIEKLLDINEFKGRFHREAKLCIQLSEIPQAWIMHPSLYFYSDTILKRLVIKTGMCPKLIAIVSCFNECFIECIRKSELEPSPCLSHFYSPHLKSLVALLCIDRFHVEDVGAHINRISDIIVDVWTKESDCCSELHWVILKFVWWMHAAIDSIITTGDIDCLHGATVLLCIYLDCKDWIEISRLKQLLSLVLSYLNCKDNYQGFGGCLSKLESNEVMLIQKLMFLLLSSNHFWTRLKHSKIHYLLGILQTLFDGDTDSLLAMTLDIVHCHLTQFRPTLLECSVQHQDSHCHALVSFAEMMQKYIVDQLHRGCSKQKSETETHVTTVLSGISKFIECMSLPIDSTM